MSNSKPTRTTAALITVALLIPNPAHAGSVFRAVWYPDGEITYFIPHDAAGALTAITDTMTYIRDHTPLEVTLAQNASSANLLFEATWVAPNNGGYTYAYWDENRSDSNKKIRIDPNNLPSPATVAHEFGHALGFPHEFQRPNRDSYVDVCFNFDPFNYSKPGTWLWPDSHQELSSYDFASVMNDGYSGCVSPLAGQIQQNRDYEGVPNLLSMRDINSIYRVYGKGMGANDPGDRFGVAVSSGDYDDDSYKDVVVANIQNGSLWLSFYRGVGTAAVEAVVGHKYAPWFKVQHDDAVDDDARVTLATGDFNGDGIEDLALGQPDYDTNRGRVSILFVNSLRTDPDKDDFEDDFAPWGRKGVQYRIDIHPPDVGLTSFSVHPQFGASLAAIRGTNFRDADGDAVYHDLAIGAPFAAVSEAYNSVHKGAVVIVKGGVDTSPADFSIATHQIVWSPSNTVGEFGAAVTAVPGLCYSAAGQTSKYYTDYIAAGSPGWSDGDGAVYVYGCLTTGSGSSLTAPGLIYSAYATGTESRFGHALAGFREFTGVYRHSYLAIGQPEYEAADGKKVGRVSVYEVGANMAFVAGYVPSVHDGQDDFGYALAVQQHQYTSGVIDEGNMTYIGIGMPGAMVNGVRAGKVLIWRPLYAPGVASVVEATDPDASTDTRFGESIATLRPLQDSGGFVAGAPDAITPDGVQAGQVSTLQNDFGNAGWSTIRRNLDQETAGDVRPTN